MNRLIALYSPAPQSGKSTVAEYLVSKYGYTRVPFAKVLKEMVRPLYKALGYSDEDIALFETVAKHEEVIEGVTARKIYQTLGTEWGRNCIDKELWIKAWAETVIRLPGDIVVDDMRFENEYDIVNQIGGHFIKVVRPGVERTTTHASEGALDYYYFNATINNDGTKEQLFQAVDKIPFLCPKNS